MPDELDTAQQETEFLTEMQVHAARSGAAGLKPTGHCYNCEEALPLENQLFCDTACAQDYERRMWAQRMRG